MKYELFAVAIFLLVGTALSNEDTVVADDPDDIAGEGEDVVHYWGTNDTDTYDGTSDVYIHPDDEWEVANPLGNEWDPNEEATREGTDTGGNPNDPNQDFIYPELGDEEVIGPAIQVFEGRYASESLATEHGRGGGARGHARGRGRGHHLGQRNLRAKKLN